MKAGHPPICYTAGINELERLCRQQKRKMEPQNTQNTQMEKGGGRVSLLSKRITGCALTGHNALGTRSFLRSNASSWACNATPPFVCSLCFAVPFSFRSDRPRSGEPGQMAVIAQAGKGLDWLADEPELYSDAT